MTRARETLSRWMAGRKFALTVAYWFFCYFGAAIIYLHDCINFIERIEVFNDAMEWSLYGLYGFVGMEGTKEIFETIKTRRLPKIKEDAIEEN